MEISTKDKMLTQNEKFEFESLINDVINHPFLHYYPYAKDDETIISDSENRAGDFKQFPDSYIDFLNQCCSICYIGDIQIEENPYTQNGEIVQYKTLSIEFEHNGKSSKINVNKSDFNPRKYLTVLNYGPGVFSNKFCEKNTVEIDDRVKTSSLVNDEPEIEEHLKRIALMAYSISTISGFGTIGMAYRLYTDNGNLAKLIREQILRTQQYILCSLLFFPRSINLKENKFDEVIFDKYRSVFEQMYNSVCLEIKDRKIESSIKEIYEPTFLTTKDLSLECDYKEVLPSNVIENLENEGYEISEYAGLYAIEKYTDFYSCGSNMIDRSGNVFKPRFRDSLEYIEDSEVYSNFEYEIYFDSTLFICYADDIEYSEFHKNYDVEYDSWREEIDEENTLFNDNYNESDFYYDQEECDSETFNHYFLGLINKYGHTIFEIRSLIPLRKSFNTKFKFKAYNDDYIIVCLADSYDIKKDCKTKCGAINIKKGIMEFPLIFTEKEIKKQLDYGLGFEDKRFYNVGWKFNYGSNLRDPDFFDGPIYKNANDILEQGKYIGFTIQDAIYYHGREVLEELVFENKIFIADTVFDNNIAKWSPIERSIKLHQDKHLLFDRISDIDDVIVTQNGFRNPIKFASLYEGKTIYDAVVEGHGMFYIKSMVSDGIIEIDKDVINLLIEIDAETFAPIKDAYNEHKSELEESERERDEYLDYMDDEESVRSANNDFNDMMNDYDAWSNID